MTAILDLPVETKADLAEAVARLYALIHPAPDVSGPVLDGLQRVCAWGREYLIHPDTVHRHFVQDAGADLEEIEPGDDVETELIAAALRVCAVVGTAVKP